MKTAILTCFDSGFKPVSDLTLPILMEYCDRHGYALSVERNPSCEWKRDGNPIVWHRLRMVERLLQEYDFLVWMDADCLITNMNYKLPQSEGKMFTVTEDCHGLNDGVMVIRSNDMTGFWINAMRAYITATSPQHAMQMMMGNVNFKSEVATLPQRDMNSYLYWEYKIPHPEGQWQSGDLCLHLPGLPISRRVELLKQYIPQIVR